MGRLGVLGILIRCDGCRERTKPFPWGTQTLQKDIKVAWIIDGVAGEKNERSTAKGAGRSDDRVRWRFGLALKEHCINGVLGESALNSVGIGFATDYTISN